MNDISTKPPDGEGAEAASSGTSEIQGQERPDPTDQEPPRRLVPTKSDSCFQRETPPPPGCVRRCPRSTGPDESQMEFYVVGRAAPTQLRHQLASEFAEVAVADCAGLFCEFFAIAPRDSANRVRHPSKYLMQSECWRTDSAKLRPLL